MILWKVLNLKWGDSVTANLQEFLRSILFNLLTAQREMKLFLYLLTFVLVLAYFFGLLLDNAGLLISKTKP